MAIVHKTAKRTRRLTPRAARARTHTPLDTRLVVNRIDAMIAELEMMRRQLMTTPQAVAPSGLTEELFGAAGRGSRDEYDLNLDWVRFSEWQTR
jgi:hypothetical protein